MILYVNTCFAASKRTIQTETDIPLYVYRCCLFHALVLTFLFSVYWLKQNFNREREAVEKIKEAHRKVMIANHPDAGGSHYLASKINEAKDVMTAKLKDSDSAF